MSDIILVAGMDEAGRGPLAGPVTAACVIMPDGEQIPGVRDSKKLGDAARRRLSDEIKKHAVAYNIAFVDEKTIDRINILEAARLAMVQALSGMPVKPQKLMSDFISGGVPTDIPYENIVRGDDKFYCISAASILAKVARDEYMEQMAVKYPGYGFEKHKGYPTAAHREAIRRLGPCPIHRMSFNLGL